MIPEIPEKVRNIRVDYDLASLEETTDESRAFSLTFDPKSTVRIKAEAG